MAPIHALVVFDKPTPHYYAGEILSGNVIVRLEKAMPITEVKVKFKGKGEVEWTETKGSGDSKRTVRYSNHENYLNHKMYIFQSNVGETFGNGEHRFAFSIILPMTLAESFHTSHGDVKYSCKAKVTSSERIGILSYAVKESAPFTVHANAPIPDHVFQMKTEQGCKNLPMFSDCCCCCSSGKVFATMTIDRGGYVPGETISFNSEISNKSTTNLQSITLAMKQLIVCIASTGKTNTKLEQINKVICPQGLQAGADTVWPASVVIPHATPPTNLGTCKIITVEYYLEIDIGEDSGCCAPDVHFRIPFMIGSATQQPMMAPQMQPTFQPGYPPAQPGYPPTQPGYPPTQPGYPPTQPGYPPTLPGYPPSQPGYPPTQPGFPPAQPGFPPQQPGGYPPPQSGYPPPQQPFQPGYPPPQQQIEPGFAPSCPPAATEQPLEFKKEFDSVVDAPPK